MKRPTLISLLMTVAVVAGLIFAVVYERPVILVACALPASLYEVVRTEGFYTRLFSGTIALLLLAQLIAIFAGWDYDLAKQTVVVLGIAISKVQILLPFVVAVLSVALVKRTWGKYTTWLAIVLVVASVGIIYVQNKAAVINIAKKIQGS